jgi:hypothetical protein
VALVVLDTSVIIGFLDPEDALHEACVAAISKHQHDDLVAPASVYAEILVAPYRVGPDAVAEIEAFVSDFAIRVEPVTASVARAAARLRGERTALRIPDALVLATAEEIAADMLLTGDARLAAVSPLVTVVQP